ncbi:hypothetical protein WJX72_011222 [[Myrmecia] bisecta]|uniref:Uncharacterized protein n=1 Tax=[Myrmecia] bisecta TaxID=41462 RepID=A0AAW1QSM7_9CHLO
MAWLLSQLSLLPELASYAASQAQQHSSAGSQAALASLKAQVTEALTQREHAAVFELAVALVLRSFDASERTPAPASRNALVEELLVGVCAKHASALWLPAQLASLWPQAFLHAALHHTSSSDTTVTGHVALVMDFVASGNPKDVSDAIQASVANALQHADPSQLPVLCKWLGLACKAPLTVQAAAEGVVAAVRDWWSALSSSSAATSTAIAPPPEPHVVVPYHYAQLTGRASVPGPPARQQGAHEAEVSSWAARCVAEPWADPTAALKTLARLAFGSGQAQSGSGPSASNGFAWTLKQALSASWGTVFRHVQEDTSADAAFDLLSRLLSSEANSSVALSYWDAEARAYQLLGFLLDLISRPEADVATMILRDRRVRQASALLQRMLASPRLLYLVVDVLVASGVLLALQRSAQQEGPRPKMLAQSLQALTPPVGLTANGRRVPARVLSLERDGGEGMSLLEQNRRPLRAPDGGEAQKRRRLDNGAAPEAFNPAIPLLAHHGAAHLASVKLRLVGLLHSVALAHEKGPEAVANNIQERLVDAFGAPPTRAMYHAHLPRAPPITWHVHVIEVLRLSEFLGAAIEGCGQRGGQEALLPVMPVVLAALADCIARYGAAAQAKGAMAADKADALWVLRVLKHTGWLPDVLLATGELFHALPNQDISSLLLIGWHIVASELDRLEGKVLPDQATGGAPLQGRNTSGPYNVNTNGGYGQASVASSAAAVIALERKWRGVILPLLHRHIAVVGPQYGRFVALLSEQ